MYVLGRSIIYCVSLYCHIGVINDDDDNIFIIRPIAFWNNELQSITNFYWPVSLSSLICSQDMKK